VKEKAARLVEKKKATQWRRRKRNRKCYPRVNISLEIPNFNLKDILRRLGAPNWRSIWPNFIQFFLKFTHASQGVYYVDGKVLTDVIWITYYVGWNLPIEIVSSTPLQNFQILNFYFFQSFLLRLWVATNVEYVYYARL